MLTIQFDQFPVIETNRLQLRKPAMDDADFLFRLRTNDAVMKYIGRNKPKSRDEIITLINRMSNDFDQSTGITWILNIRETGSAIGTMGFWRMDKENHRAEIGYMLDPEYHGRGLAGEAMHAVLSYGFEILKFHSVEANVDPGNEASKKLLIRNGFIQEAYFRENYYTDEQFQDSVIFSLLHHEYKAP